MRKTKIVCTIGPSTCSYQNLHKLIASGLDVARLNFSHGTHDSHAEVIRIIRELSKHCGRPIAILQDLSGPKVRLGKIACQAVALKRGQRIRLTTRDVPGDIDELCLPVPEMIAAVKPGDRLLADDGRIELAVVSKDADSILVRAIVAGVLSSNKGITAPGVSLDIAAVTEKDKDDLRFGLLHGVDFVAASYVRRAEDLLPLKQIMEEMGIKRPIIAKIEKMEAVRRISQILASVDGIMVARGDLGVEIPIDEVPLVQKQIIKLCNAAGKPVITATQMLDSMIHNPRPTRAEVTDIANAILDGTDAVMLSGETAAGDYPFEAVKMMAKVAVRADDVLPDRTLLKERFKSESDVTDVLSRATVKIAAELKVAAILCATTSGSTVRSISRYRPTVQLIGVTPVEQTFRNLALTWGVRPILIDTVYSSDDMMKATISAAIEKNMIKIGDKVILTGGVPVNVVGNTNLIRVHVVGQPLTPDGV